MCGRFALHLLHRDVQEQLAAQEWINQDQFVPRYNIAPRSQAPVLRMSQPSASASGSGSGSNNGASTSKSAAPDADERPILHTMKWGLVPHWNKFEDLKMNTTNARSENLVEGTGMWNSIKGRKRCAVVCDGYYEWLTKGKQKLPHFTRHKAGKKLMLMAGLYDSVVLEGQTEPLWTFTIVTTAATKDFEWLHERQPVILSTPEALQTWLDTSTNKWNDDLADLLKPYSDRKSPLECFQVPTEVGKVGKESPTFIEPIEKRKDGIEAMFAKQKTNSKSASPTKTQLKPVSKRKKPKDDSDDEVVILDSPPPPAKKIKRT